MSQLFRTTRLENIPYRTMNGHTLFLDIVRPDPLPPAPMPVIVHLFGSGWSEALRRNEEQNPAQFLASHAGLSVASIDYRLSSQAHFPAQIADARAAVRWLRANAATYQLDPAHIGTWGYSSGGHLAALLGTAADEPSLDDSTELADVSCHVQAVFTVSCPVNFLIMGGWHDNPDSPESRLIGGPVQENVELALRASPLTYINKSNSLPPFHLAHGEQDDTVLPDQSQALYQALLAAGADATLLMIPGARHALGRSTPYWDTIGQAAVQFFQKHLR